MSVREGKLNHTIKSPFLGWLGGCGGRWWWCQNKHGVITMYNDADTKMIRQGLQSIEKLRMTLDFKLCVGMFASLARIT